MGLGRWRPGLHQAVVVDVAAGVLAAWSARLPGPVADRALVYLARNRGRGRAGYARAGA
jgi:hypothetical protein